MHRPPMLIALVAALPLFLGSCATIVSTAHYTVPIRSEPTGAHFVITDREGIAVREGTTPAIVELRSSHGYFQPASYRIVLSKEGYQPAHTALYSRLNEWCFGNILLGPFGVIGFFVVDPLTGSAYRIVNPIVYEGLGRLE